MAGRLTNMKQRFRAMKDLLDPPLGPDALPLEIRAAVLDAIERKITVRGINDRVFKAGLSKQRPGFLHLEIMAA